MSTVSRDSIQSGMSAPHTRRAPSARRAGRTPRELAPSTAGQGHAAAAIRRRRHGAPVIPCQLAGQLAPHTAAATVDRAPRPVIGTRSTRHGADTVAHRRHVDVTTQSAAPRHTAQPMPDLHKHAASAGTTESVASCPHTVDTRRGCELIGQASAPRRNGIRTLPASTRRTGVLMSGRPEPYPGRVPLPPAATQGPCWSAKCAVYGSPTFGPAPPWSPRSHVLAALLVSKTGGRGSIPRCGASPVRRIPCLELRSGVARVGVRSSCRARRIRRRTGFVRRLRGVATARRIVTSGLSGSGGWWAARSCTVAAARSACGTRTLGSIRGSRGISGTRTRSARRRLPLSTCDATRRRQAG